MSVIQLKLPEPRQNLLSTASCVGLYARCMRHGVTQFHVDVVRILRRIDQHDAEPIAQREMGARSLRAMRQLEHWDGVLMDGSMPVRAQAYLPQAAAGWELAEAFAELPITEIKSRIARHLCLVEDRFFLEDLPLGASFGMWRQATQALGFAKGNSIRVEVLDDMLRAALARCHAARIVAQNQNLEGTNFGN